MMKSPSYNLQPTTYKNTRMAASDGASDGALFASDVFLPLLHCRFLRASASDAHQPTIHTAARAITWED